MRKSIFSKLIYSTLFITIFIPTLNYGGNPERAKNGMVVSASAIASQVGIQILKNGGNSIDAAVAVGFALAVTYPVAGNIGGGGFMVIHLADGRNTTIDFRETAPLAANEKMFLDSLGNYIPESSQVGWKSAGVPGTVAGLIYALHNFGTLKLQDVIQPAIDLAENGFVLTADIAESINKYNSDFNKIPSSRKIFTRNGNALIDREMFIQKDLANTLKLIRDGGEKTFYDGELTERFLDESIKSNGLFSKKDFITYKPVERKPVVGNYRGYEIISMAPPSSGGVALIEALNILEHYNYKSENWGSSDYLHVLVETMKLIYADRSKYLGDPEFVDIPVNKLISKTYSDKLASLIKDQATPSETIYSGVITRDESYETTHYSVIDSHGNAVSTTYTLNSAFGNKVVVDGLGFLLNNEMDDFSVKPGVPNQFGLIGSKANSIQPKKRMLSSMTPTIILKDGKPFMIIGSPGGSTIITSVLQTIINVIDFNMNIYDAISFPKIHHQLFPDEINYEQFGISEDVKQNLILKGHKFGPVKSLGRMEGIVIDYKDGIFFGTSDPRGFGKAIGY